MNTQTYIQILESISQSKFPQDCNLNSTKVNEYLNSINDENKKQLIKLILDNTVFINTDIICKNTKNKVEDFLHLVNENFYVYLPKKISSEWYFTSIVLNDILANKYFSGFIGDNKITDYSTENNINILIIDDFILTGNNIVSVMDEFSYNYPSINYTFNIIVSHYTDDGINNIKSIVRNLKKSIKYIIHKTTKLITIKELLKDQYNFDKIYNLIGCESECAVPFYTNHKCANLFGSFPQIYLNNNLLNVNPSKQSIINNYNLLKNSLNSSPI